MVVGHHALFSFFVRNEFEVALGHLNRRRGGNGNGTYGQWVDEFAASIKHLSKNHQNKKFHAGYRIADAIDPDIVMRTSCGTWAFSSPQDDPTLLPAAAITPTSTRTTAARPPRSAKSGAFAFAPDTDKTRAPAADGAETGALRNCADDVIEVGGTGRASDGGGQLPPPTCLVMKGQQRLRPPHRSGGDWPHRSAARGQRGGGAPGGGGATWGGASGRGGMRRGGGHRRATPTTRILAGTAPRTGDPTVGVLFVMTTTTRRGPTNGPVRCMHAVTTAAAVAFLLCCLVSLWRWVSPLVLILYDVFHMHLVEEKSSIKVHVVRREVQLQGACSITHKRQPGVVSCFFPAVSPLVSLIPTRHGPNR